MSLTPSPGRPGFIGAPDSDYRNEAFQGFREAVGFTGKEEDTAIGLTYFGKRYYSPYLLRWMTPDPLEVHAPGEADANLYAYVSGQAMKSVDPAGLDLVVLHGGGPGSPDTIKKFTAFVNRAVLARRDAGLPRSMQSHYMVTNSVEQNYDSTGTIFSQGTHDVPDKGARYAEQYQHTPAPEHRPYGEAPRALAGFSIGGDAALQAGGPKGGGKWDYRIVVGSRTDGNFVDNLVNAAATSERLVYVGVKGDVNLQNDFAAGLLLGKSDMARFGDRSYETAVASIEKRFGSMSNFYKAHPNVSVMGVSGEHGGAAERPETHNAIKVGLDQVDAQMKASAAQPSQAPKQETTPND
ncbi:MAG: hypothetical protein RJA70_205 [Pseudomonadota bacterium]